MLTALDTTELREVSRFIAESMGLHFPEERWPDLARGLAAAGHELGFEYPGGCASWLRNHKLTVPQIESLASHLTVGETYFLRDPASFEVLEQEILPLLVTRRIQSTRTLRMWSAGCCTGEEAYSLAISCVRALPDLRAWNVSILGTDINSKFLAKAKVGVYSPWSFRGAPDWLRKRFFTSVADKQLAIEAIVKSLVHFSYLNLAEDVYPSLHNHTQAMDVIFCRNVLMYFTPDHQRRVVTALHRCLVDGGYLLVNPAEASSSLFPMFATENIGGVMLYRKTSQPTHVESSEKTADAQSAICATPPTFVAAPALEPTGDVTPATAVSVILDAPAETALPIAAMTESPQVSPLAWARACANHGSLEEALAWCQLAIEAERSNIAAHFLHAMIYQELGRLEEAIAALGKVLYLDQDFVLAHHALGGLYKQLGRQKQASRHLAIALALLSTKSSDEIVPESEGMTCGRLVESVRAMTGS